MTHFKTILMTAALLAVPSVAWAQVSTDALKDKAIDSVMDNMTTDDAIIAGTTMIKGGSKEDAAIAVVKNRANAKIESMTGGVSVDDLSKDGMIAASKDMAIQKATGSSTTYTDGVSLGDVSTDGAMDAGKAMAMEKAKAYGETYGMSDQEKAKSMITTGDSYVIQKSGAEIPTMSAPTVSAPTVTMAPVNCPSGTKDAGDGTCMITGDWKP